MSDCCSSQLGLQIFYPSKTSDHGSGVTENISAPVNSPANTIDKVWPRLRAVLAARGGSCSGVRENISPLPPAKFIMHSLGHSLLPPTALGRQDDEEVTSEFGSSPSKVGRPRPVVGKLISQRAKYEHYRNFLKNWEPNLLV
ncbi:hypothetical protein TNCV_1870421 [Trichonephila clavipes]|nr:hypothetical protein TNCV_1870421 [Trichonephila clavipes]